MFVQQILASKSDAKVWTVNADDAVAIAIKTLAHEKIGAVVIIDTQNRPIGIFSERDVVYGLSKRDNAYLQEPMHRVMTTNPETCCLDETADSVLARMTRGRFRHLPVVEKGSMVGLISIGDVVRARLLELATEKQALENMIMGY